MFEALRIYYPELVPFVRAFYLDTGQLIFNGLDGVTMLESAEGSGQQGDPIASFLYAIMTKPTWDAVALEFKDKSAVAVYADNGYFVVRNQVDIPAVLASIVARLAKVGLSVDMKQKEVFSFSGISASVNAALHPDVVRCQDGIIILGAPVGTLEFMRAEVKRNFEAKLKDVFPTAAHGVLHQGQRRR